MNCPNCGHELSPLTDECPFCKYDFREQEKKEQELQREKNTNGEYVLNLLNASKKSLKSAEKAKNVIFLFSMIGLFGSFLLLTISWIYMASGLIICLCLFLIVSAISSFIDSCKQIIEAVEVEQKINLKKNNPKSSD